LTELNKNRVREMFWLFSQVLPLAKEDETTTRAVFGKSVAEILPEIAKTIGHTATNHLEMLDEYFDFVKQAIAYCRNETDAQPEVACEPARVMADTKQAIEDFDKNAKPASI